MKYIVNLLLMLLITNTAFAANTLQGCQPTYRGNDFKYVHIYVNSYGVCAYNKLPFGDGYSIGPVKPYEEALDKVWVEWPHPGEYDCNASAAKCKWLNLQ